MRKYTFLVGSDIHFPKHSVPAVRAFLKEAESGDYDVIVINGDAVDLSSISSFSADKPLELSVPVIKELERLRGFFNTLKETGSRIVYVLGNHEDRIRRYLERLPAFRGLLSINDWVPDGVEVVPFESPGFTLGSVTFTHCKGGGNVMAAVRQHAVTYPTHTVIGHFHSFASYTAPTPPGFVPRTCQAVGCLAELNQGYMLGRPSSSELGYLRGEACGERVQFSPVRL